MYSVIGCVSARIVRVSGRIENARYAKRVSGPYRVLYLKAHITKWRPDTWGCMGFFRYNADTPRYMYADTVSGVFDTLDTRLGYMYRAYRAYRAYRMRIEPYRKRPIRYRRIGAYWARNAPIRPDTPDDKVPKNPHFCTRKPTFPDRQRWRRCEGTVSGAPFPC